MKIRYFLILITFLVTYMATVTSVLYTESFVLFLAVLCIFIVYINSWSATYKKNDIKWNEVILFYSIFKNWNRALRRDSHIRMAHFLDFSIQVQKYELEWVKRNLNKINEQEYNDIERVALRRLEVLSKFNKEMRHGTRINGLRYFPLGED